MDSENELDPVLLVDGVDDRRLTDFCCVEDADRDDDGERDRVAESCPVVDRVLE